MKKQLFVHVGTEKTGTTSIQDFIARHKRDLKRRGLTFLDAGTESNHHYWLAKALGFRFAPKPVDEKKEQKAIADCRSFIEKHDDENLLLTSEHFDFNPNPENIKAFVDFFEGYEINVVLFLRDQISYCQSLYAEHIKWGGVLDFEEFIRHTIKQGRYSYLKKYQHWNEFADNVIVIDYNAKRKELIPAFLSAIGLGDFSFGHSDAGFNSNPTPSMDFLNVVRLLNSGITKSRRRQFYLDFLRLANDKYPNLLVRSSLNIPLKFKHFFEEQSIRNSELANSIGKDESNFLKLGENPGDCFEPVAEVKNCEPLLRELLFNGK